MARVVAEDQPLFVEQVNTLRSKIHRLAEEDASAVISSRKLDFSDQATAAAKPLIAQVNEQIAKLPAVYRHGINGVIEEKDPVIPYYFSAGS